MENNLPYAFVVDAMKHNTIRNLVLREMLPPVMNIVVAEGNQFDVPKKKSNKFHTPDVKLIIIVDAEFMRRIASLMTYWKDDYTEYKFSSEFQQFVFSEDNETFRLIPIDVGMRKFFELFMLHEGDKD